MKRLSFMVFFICFFAIDFYKQNIVRAADILDVSINNSSKLMQEIHDFVFRQIEISIREIGYGDVSINKNMKKYVNFFYDILTKIDNWNSCNFNEKCEILNNFIDNPKFISFYTNYFDKLCIFYKNNPLIYFTKDIEEFKI